MCPTPTCAQSNNCQWYKPHASPVLTAKKKKKSPMILCAAPLRKSQNEKQTSWALPPEPPQKPPLTAHQRLASSLGEEEGVRAEGGQRRRKETLFQERGAASNSSGTACVPFRSLRAWIFYWQCFQLMWSFCVNVKCRHWRATCLYRVSFHITVSATSVHGYSPSYQPTFNRPEIQQLKECCH